MKKLTGILMLAMALALGNAYAADGALDAAKEDGVQLKGVAEKVAAEVADTAKTAKEGVKKTMAKEKAGAKKGELSIAERIKRLDPRMKGVIVALILASCYVIFRMGRRRTGTADNAEKKA